MSQGKGKGKFRGNFRGKRSFGGKPKMEKKTKHERIIEEMKKKVQEAYSSRDIFLVTGDRTVKDLERMGNVLFERLSEWYYIYFPELKLEDRAKYCKLVLVIDKENMAESKKGILEIMGDKSGDILQKLETNSGIDFEQKDLEKVRTLARQIFELQKTQEEVEKYTENVAKEVCPNLAEVGGTKIAAKLVAHVGSLKKLAKLPASTFQVLGAEKALFKHLRGGSKPPKHGIIFQHTLIHSSPKEKRGKLSRALATKLSMAAKIDVYGKRFLGKELREQFEARAEKILKG